MEIVEKMDTESFSCDVEQESLQNYGNKNQNPNVKKPKNDVVFGSFKCDVMGCTAVFDSSVKLNWHKKGVHVPRKFACNNCGKCFKRNSQRKEHEITCLKKSQIRIYIPNRRIYKKRSKNVDICAKKIKNDVDSPFKCDEVGCTAGFESSVKLDRHKKGVHVPRKFPCLFCDKCFKRNFQKKEHEQICPKQFQNLNSENKVILKTAENDEIICQKKFQNQNVNLKIEETLKITENNNENGPFICDLDDCRAGFDSDKKLKIHKKGVHVSRKFVCLYCERSFKRKDQKKRHEQSVHAKKSKFKDKKGQKSKVSKVKKCYKLRSDSKSDPKVEKIQIKQELNEDGNDKGSDSEFDPESDAESSESDTDLKQKVSKTSKRKILKKIKLEETNEYLCTVCNQSFPLKKAVKNHEKNCKKISRKKTIENDDKKEDSFQEIHCEYGCNYVCSNMRWYNLHINSVHKGQSDKNSEILILNSENVSVKYRYAYCSLCRRKCSSKLNLQEHLKIPHKIKCPDCTMIFVENEQLFRHRVSVHQKQELEELKKFRCSKCPNKFMTEIGLKKHIEQIHERKITICSICSDAVPTASITVHLKAHKFKSSRKPYCEICSAYFTNSIKFENHLKTKLHLDKNSGILEKSKTEEFILPHDINTDDFPSLKDNSDSDSDEGIYDPAKKGTKTNPSKCRDCGLKFRNFHYKEAHREKYHGVKMPIFRCTLCNVKYRRKNDLTRHFQESVKHKMKVQIQELQNTKQN